MTFPQRGSGGGQWSDPNGAFEHHPEAATAAGLPIREIARRTGLSRNTVKKYLKAGTIEPVFATPERSSKLDPFAEKLAGWLDTETGKSRKQRRTLKQLHADLVMLGFTGSYNRVAAYARQWRADRQREQQTTGRGTFVPLDDPTPVADVDFDWFASPDVGDDEIPF